MRRGRRRKPSISVESIEAALKTLGHSAAEAPEAIALQNLALVDLYLENPARPSSEDLRAWALRSLLAQFITDALSEQRRFFDLASASITENRRTALKRIQQDSLCGSDILMAWSILFYRYVRPELAISVSELAASTNIHERTLRRYRHDALLRLRDYLTKAEWEAREVNQRRMLRARIPEKVAKLVERDAEFNQVIESLKQRVTEHFFITGTAGIGKSTFAAAIANWLIEHDDLDYLIWLSNPSRFAEVYNALEDTLLPYPSQANIGELLLEYRTLVVIDDAQSLIMQSEEWLDLLKYLNHALVIICNRVHVFFPHHIIHIPIQSLSQIATIKLITTYPRIDSSNPIIQEQIWQTVGGNPRAVDYAVRQIVNGNTIQFGNAALRSIYDDLFEQMDDEQKIMWIHFASLSENINHDMLLLIAGSEKYVGNLFDYGLIENLEEAQVFRLVPSAKQYIELCVETDEGLSTFANEYTATLIERISASSSHVSSLLLALLECSCLKLDTETHLRALNSCDVRILTIPELRRWRYLVDEVDEVNSTSLLLLNAIVARRLYQQEQAFSILQTIIEATGRRGNFIRQAEARYELAVLHQSRSEFDRADNIYQQIESYLQINADNSLKEQINRQRARMAIENSKAQIALTHLEKYRGTIQDGILVCEAHLLIGNSLVCREMAVQYLQETNNQPILAASLYTIIGRSYQQEGQTDNAIEHLSAALSLTERFSTDFDIARACSNIASLYLQYAAKYRLDEAEGLLYKAQAIQEAIKDTVGLLITERNLQHLHLQRLNLPNEAN
jgi:DNA replication protein DnaC/tetratricopeptide (TPR) repeat protein